MSDQPDPNEPRAERTFEDRDSMPWLALLKESDKAFEQYHAVSDNVEREYGNLSRLRDPGSREMQLFWANLEVIRPSIYSREPVPVATPRFKDRRPVPRKGAELLERSLISNIETVGLHQDLLLARDDLARTARGVLWLSLTTRNDGMPAVTADHVDRRDFRHGVARKWAEVPWVSRDAYLTREQMKARFEQTAPRYWNKAQFAEQDRDDDKARGSRKARVTEIWHREQNVVVWVTEGVPEVLDIAEPHMEFEGFFPCPRPAFGTLEPGTLKPIPDFAYYRDQIEEVNDLTARISALSESLRVRGLYPAGQGDLSEAIESALSDTDDRSIFKPIPSMRDFSSGSGGALVEYFPVDMVAATVTQLVELRRQMIDDIYQITGISDIMRGETVASETATAQNIKAQFGSVRIRSHQEEMVRLSRDAIRMMAEVMAEQVPLDALIAMSQVEGIVPGGQLQMMQVQAEQQGQQMPVDLVSREELEALLRQQRVRAFVLDVETDSTIQPNEDAEKQRRTEFLAAVGGMAQQALPMVERFPASAGIVIEMLKFAAGGFRAGRDLDGEIDEFGEMAKAAAQAQQQQAQQPTPDQQAQQAEMQMKQADMTAKVQLDQQRLAFEREKWAQEAQLRREELALKRAELETRFGLEVADRQADAAPVVVEVQ